jgi:hypothetical protein
MMRALIMTYHNLLLHITSLTGSILLVLATQQCSTLTGILQLVTSLRLYGASTGHSNKVTHYWKWE